MLVVGFAQKALELQVGRKPTRQENPTQTSNLQAYWISVGSPQLMASWPEAD